MSLILTKSKILHKNSKNRPKRDSFRVLIIELEFLFAP